MNELWYVLTQHWDEDCDYDSEVAFFLSEDGAISYAIESAFKFGTAYENEYDYDDYDVKVSYGVERYKFIDVDVKYKNSDERVAHERYEIGKVIPKNSEE